MSNEEKIKTKQLHIKKRKEEREENGIKADYNNLRHSSFNNDHRILNLVIVGLKYSSSLSIISINGFEKYSLFVYDINHAEEHLGSGWGCGWRKKTFGAMPWQI